MVLSRRLDWTTASIAYLLPGYVLGLETHWTSFTGHFILKSHDYNTLLPVELGYLYLSFEEKFNAAVDYHFLDVRRAMHIINDTKKMEEKIIPMISPYHTVVQSVLCNDKTLPKILEENGITDREDFLKRQLNKYQKSLDVDDEHIDSKYRELREKLIQFGRKVKK